MQFKKPLKYLAFAWIVVFMQLPQLLQAETQSATNLFRQEIVTVKGTVKDAGDGQSLPGVTISDSQRKVLGVTDVNGSFSVKVAKGTEVSFSMLGYTAVKRMVTAATNTMSISMASSSSDLNEVVVTALGIKREEKSLGYSVTKVDSTQLTEAVSSNWTDALSGKVAGLNLVRNGGPAGSNKIILRGENNLTGDNEALIVIDGVVISSGSRRTAASGGGAYGTGGDNQPTDFGSGVGDINPDDIESVTVLKGPGAAALYGLRGANGAILITTKSGNSKKKRMGITFTSNTKYEQINRGPDVQYEFGQGLAGVSYFSYGASADGSNQNATSASWGAPFEGQMFFQYDPATKKVGKERTPWRAYEGPMDAFFKTGLETNNAVSLDGTYKKTTIRFSASHGDNQWIVPNTGYDRTSVTLSTNTKVNEKLDISLKAMYNNKHSDNLPATGYGNQSLMYWFMFAQPNVNVEWYKDYWVPGKEFTQFVNITTTNPESPYAISEQYLNTQRRNGYIGNIQANYKFNKEWSLMLRGTLDKAFDEREQMRPWDAAGSKFAHGSYRVQNINTREISGDFLLRYDKSVNKNLRITTTVGGSMLSNVYNKNEQRADGLIVPNDYRLENAENPLIYVPDTARYKINSVYSLMSLAYKNYLYLDLTYRVDWNSVLASKYGNKVSSPYPSASLSFIASDYFKLPKSINLAKFRFSLSQVGSGATTPYRTAYNYITAANGIYPDNALQNPTILPNYFLLPLRTTTIELGADIRLFKSRLGFDVAVYSGNTKNQILTRQLDRATGYTHAIFNAGRVDNQGLEVAINAIPVEVKKGFKWSVNFNFATNRNEIKELLDSSVILRTGALGGGQVVANIGGSMGDLYGIGFQRSPDGQIIYDEESGFAKATSGVIYLGNTIPKWKFGFSNTFSYKSFSLSTLFDAQLGGVAHSLTASRMGNLGKLKSTLPGRYNGIIGNGVVQNADGTFRPNDVIAKDVPNYYNSVFGSEQAEGSIFSTDFLKFREANLTYAFKSSFLKKLDFNKLTIGVYARDLFIWSPWPAFDPEFGTLAGSDIVTGFETGQLPSTRSFGFRLVVGL
ncbi:SusC/RagA family TonB-linked outer membrane protein [Pedobacter hiemivivus]|nr:SusC/RagA family TonB-linked outer membrane protein [Pedobacter hiemivivus]